MGENKLPPDYAYLEQLSMEQLIEIIHADADSTSSGNEDFIFAVLEVIEKRQMEQPDYQPTDIDDAWEDFQQYFNTPDGEGLSLYPAENPSNQKPNSAVPHHMRWTVRKTLAIIAAAIVMLFAGVLTAQATGIDVFGTIARWTDEIFHFESSAGEMSDDTEWVSALMEQGVDLNLIPTWIPEGFEAAEVTVQDFGLWKEIYQPFYTSEGQSFGIRVRTYADITYAQESWYEKDALAVNQFVCNGRTVYIFSNVDDDTVVSLFGNVEISIIGNFSQDVIETIFNSISKGE